MTKKEDECVCVFFIILTFLIRTADETTKKEDELMLFVILIFILIRTTCDKESEDDRINNGKKRM